MTNSKVNEGIETLEIKRLGFTIPENVGMNSKVLTKIDSIANYAISKKMTPGFKWLLLEKEKLFTKIILEITPMNQVKK